MTPDLDTATSKVIVLMFRDIESIVRADTPNPADPDAVLSRVVDVLDDYESYVDRVIDPNNKTEQRRAS